VSEHYRTLRFYGFYFSVVLSSLISAVVYPSEMTVGKEPTICNTFCLILEEQFSRIMIRRKKAFFMALSVEYKALGGIHVSNTIKRRLRTLIIEFFHRQVGLMEMQRNCIKSSIGNMVHD